MPTNASTLKSPVLLAFIILAGLAVCLVIVGLFGIVIYRDGSSTDVVVTTFTAILGTAFGVAGPLITHMIYALSGVPQPGETTTTTTQGAKQGANNAAT